MATTTIGTSDDLKARVAAAAERAGKTSHSFILEAIAGRAEQTERRSDFDDVVEWQYCRHRRVGQDDSVERDAAPIL